jgi:hypothetical protein
MFKKFHKSRGNEDRYFTKAKGCVVCSLDGLNFEYNDFERQMRRNGTKLKEKTEDLLRMPLELLKDEHDRMIRKCRLAMETALDWIKSVWPRSKVKSKFGGLDHFVEEIVVDFVSVDMTFRVLLFLRYKLYV